MAEASNSELHISWDKEAFDAAAKTTNFPNLNLYSKKIDIMSAVRASFRAFSLKKSKNEEVAEAVSRNAKITYITFFYIKMKSLQLPCIAMIIYYYAYTKYNPDHSVSNTQIDIRDTLFLCKQLVLHLYYMYIILSSNKSNQDKIYSITVNGLNIENLISSINLNIKNLSTILSDVYVITDDNLKKSLNNIFLQFLKKIPSGSEKFKDELKQEDLESITTFITRKLEAIPREKAAVAAEHAKKAESQKRAPSGKKHMHSNGYEKAFLGRDAPSLSNESYGGSRHRKRSSSKSKKSSSSLTRKQRKQRKH
jgi:hypothetical protein